MRTNQLPHSGNPMDAWLLAAHRKYRILIPKDGDCLYRAIADQICPTQHHYSDVKTKLINYCFRHLRMERVEEFEDMELNDKLEIISTAYEINIVVYTDVSTAPKTFGNYGSTKQTIYLRLDPEDQTLESVKDIEHMETTALCQSLLYEVLYEHVFGISKELQEDTVHKVRQKLYNHPHKSDRQRPNKQTSSATSNELNTEELPPFPFRVAKSLDPEFYRNEVYDVWQDAVKEKEQQYKLGDKVCVTLEGDSFIGHVQHIEEDGVLVFIEPPGSGKNIFVTRDMVSKTLTSKKCSNKERTGRTHSRTPSDANDRNRTSTPQRNRVQQPVVVSHAPTNYYLPSLAVQPQHQQMYHPAPVRLSMQQAAPSLQPILQPPYWAPQYHHIVPSQGASRGYCQPPPGYCHPLPAIQPNMPAYVVPQYGGEMQPYPATAPNAPTWTVNNPPWNGAGTQGNFVPFGNQLAPHPQQIAPAQHQ